MLGPNGNSQGNAGIFDGYGSNTGTGVGNNGNIVDIPSTGVEGLDDAIDVLEDILNKIFEFASLIGIVLLAWGIVMFVLAIKSEDAESKSRAVLLMVAAIVLVCIGSFAQPILSAIGG